MPANPNRPKSDWYPTPPECTRALLNVEAFHGLILEPACGDGAISKVLEAAGHVVHSCDLYDTGYGHAGVDFLKDDIIVENIVTNPPFRWDTEFTLNAIRRSTEKAVLLLRLAFLEGTKRHKWLFRKYPPSRIWVFIDRLTMYPGDVEPGDNGGTTAFAWFVWDKAIDPPKTKPTLGWINSRDFR